MLPLSNAPSCTPRCSEYSPSNIPIAGAMCLSATDNANGRIVIMCSPCFGSTEKKARNNYRNFVSNVVAQGNKPEWLFYDPFPAAFAYCKISVSVNKFSDIDKDLILQYVRQQGRYSVLKILSLVNKSILANFTLFR